MARSFDGSNVVVTGGSTGIGLATALAFGRAGANIGIVSRDPAKLAKASERVHEVLAPGRRVETFAADVSDLAQAEAAISHMESAGLAPDVLVNSAGIIIPGRFEEMDASVFTTTMENGYFSVLYPTRAAVPGMIARGRGHIVNVSSGAGFLGLYGYTAYSSAKYAVMGFTEALRSEMKPHGIAVSVVCPPDTDTPGLAYEKTLRPPETDKLAGNVKPVSPEFVASAIVRGVSRGDYIIIPGFLTKLYYRLRSIAPWIVFAVIDSDVASVRKSSRAPGEAAGETE